MRGQPGSSLPPRPPHLSWPGGHAFAGVGCHPGSDADPERQPDLKTSPPEVSRSVRDPGPKGGFGPFL